MTSAAIAQPRRVVANMVAKGTAFAEKELPKLSGFPQSFATARRW